MQHDHGDKPEIEKLDEASAAQVPRRARGGMPAWVGAVLFVLGALAILTVAFDLGTASPRLCASCHEMAEMSAAWQSSAHRVVSCVECHQSPTEWFEVPARLSERVALLSRYLGAHWSEASALSSSAPPEPITDDICLQCHDPNRKATSGYRILIDHVEHAKRNGSCVSCHVRTAHPTVTRGGPLSLMGQCYTCHGTADHPGASTECGTCHPEGYELYPASHEALTWARSHGRTSEADQGLCGMCHASTFCSDCHGIQMPHPDRWAAGDEGHALAATADPDTCSRCHDGGPQLCSMCHHVSFEPFKGGWAEQHAFEVRAEGTAYCMSCHEPRYCSYCHTRLVERDGSE